MTTEEAEPVHDELIPERLPKATKVAVLDLAHQLGVGVDDLVAEAILARLPAWEERRRIVEQHRFPKPLKPSASG